MIEVKVKRLKLVDKMICIQISEHDLVQWLNFFHRQRDFFIYIDDITVVNVHDTQSEELLILSESCLNDTINEDQSW